MKKVLTSDFFARDTHKVAQELLGKYLVHACEGTIYSARITDVEVYDGFEDKASHAHKGMTPRNAVMFGKSGIWYVYLCYGIHFMLNIVTREEGHPSAILIRGVSGIVGPGRVTRSLNIDMRYNHLPAQKRYGLWIEDRGEECPGVVVSRPRIGVAYAGAYCASREWRYVLEEACE
jgi:DNA-3-methyladenine glycosylase